MYDTTMAIAKWNCFLCVLSDSLLHPHCMICWYQTTPALIVILSICHSVHTICCWILDDFVKWFIGCYSWFYSHWFSLCEKNYHSMCWNSTGVRLNKNQLFSFIECNRSRDHHRNAPIRSSNKLGENLLNQFLRSVICCFCLFVSVFQR